MFDANNRVEIIRKGGEVFDALSTNVTAYSEALDALVYAETELRRAADALEQQTIAAKWFALDAIAQREASGEKFSAPARDAYISETVRRATAAAFGYWREQQAEKDNADATVQANKRAIDASRAALDFLTAVLTTTVPTVLASN